MRTPPGKESTRWRGGAILLALLAATIVYSRTETLPPVNAPLAPAAPGTWFAPATIPPPPLPGRGWEAEEVVSPRSTGTHITAILQRHDGSTLVAVWGDPLLWERHGGTWKPAANLPPLTGKAAEVIGLTEDPQTAVVSIITRREGNFVARDGAWSPLPHRNAPYDANAQALTGYRGVLFVATLNDGLVLRDGKGIWSHIAPPTISTNAPRQFVTWHDDLYVRHGNGTVDRFDGRTWTRDVFSHSLPRHEVSALATDGQSLFLAQWAGWSETNDGHSFSNHFPTDLHNVPITALLPLKDSLVVGTQGRGIAACDRNTGFVRVWQDERQGISDDWITSLTSAPSGQIIAGTFVGGAFSQDTNVAPSATPWQSIPTTQSDCVTATEATPEAVYVALRSGGVRRYAKNGSVCNLSDVKEAQCLFADVPNHLLWVGTRMGISVLRLPDSHTDWSVASRQNLPMRPKSATIE